MDIHLEYGHFYKFYLYVEVHADTAGLSAAIADFGGIWFNDSRIEWGYVSIPNIQDSGGGGGGGCGGSPFGPPLLCSPTLFVWNGSEYVKEATFDLHGDSDVTVRHKIEQLLASENDHYLLSLRELNQSVSYIDYVRLYTVDTEGVMHENNLTYARHNELGNVKQLLKFDDDNRVELGSSQTINLKFETKETANTAYYIFEIQGYEPASS